MATHYERQKAFLYFVPWFMQPHAARAHDLLVDWDRLRSPSVTADGGAPSGDARREPTFQPWTIPNLHIRT